MWYNFQSGFYLIAIKIPLEKILLGTVSSACSFLRSSYQAVLQGARKGSGSSSSPERDLKRWLGECRRFVIEWRLLILFVLTIMSKTSKVPAELLFKCQQWKCRGWGVSPVQANAEGCVVWAPHCDWGRLGLNFLSCTELLRGYLGHRCTCPSQPKLSLCTVGSWSLKEGKENNYCTQQTWTVSAGWSWCLTEYL